jgi:integral membrane protein (TIGR01906 family)
VAARIRIAVLGVCLAVLALGLALMPLLTASFTHTLSARYSLVAESGLTSPRVAEVAEQVRRFVVSGGVGTLPETVDGRPGFDGAAVAHLADVAAVIAWARLATALLACVVFVWVAIAVWRGRFDEMAAALRVGAIATLVSLALAVVAAFADFEAVFSAFHGLFFAAGTWTFPYDSLLIQVFPEPFWMWAGMAWGAGSALVAGVYLLLARVAKHAASGTSDPREGA